MPDTNDLESSQTVTEASPNKPDPSNFDAKKPNTVKSLTSPGIQRVKLRLPKLGFPKFKLSRPKLSLPKVNFLAMWLTIILISYVCMGYFFSVLLTVRPHRDLAIAGFVIIALLPILTAFADYALMKWSYLISGFLIIGGLVFLVRLKFYLLVVALIAWIGLTAIAFVGDVLLKSRKLWMAIVILTAPCLIGLGIGHQMWRLATSWS
ncbi:MAG: hypothetical protein ACKO7R_18945 [Pseudanabaena sp.]